MSHCARARSYHGKRAILDLERTRGEKLAYMDTYRWIFRFFTPLTFGHEAARIESRCRKFDSRQIGRQNSTPLRSPFPLLSLALAFLSQPRRESNGITFSSYLRWPSILSIHHRVSIGEHLLRQKLSALPSTVCRSARLPSARSAELSFLSRFFHSRSRYPSSPPPPDKRIAFASISRRKEKRIDEFDSMNNSIRGERERESKFRRNERIRSRW